MKYIFWIAVAAIRVVLWVLGWFFVPVSLIGDGARRTPAMWTMWIVVEHTPAAYSTSRWKKYVWWAWRNPTPGWIGKWKQPIPEDRPNPDRLVRVGKMHNGAMVKQKSASRWMEHGVYWEYWYLSQIDWSIFGKQYRWFEFRIGWKFVDGNDEFFPTLQLGPRSS